MGADAIGEPAVEISAKGRDEPVVRNLPNVIPRTLLSGVCSFDIPLQGARSYSTPAGDSLRHLASGLGRLNLVRTKLSGCTRQKLKKAKASQAGTRGTQQPGNAGTPKHGETSTRTSKRPKLEDTTPTERARPPKRPRDSSGPGTYKEALTNIKIAIFKENYPEDKLTKDNQDQILDELGRVFCGTPKGEQLPHLRSFKAGGRRIHLCARQPTVWSVAH
jgi:hypothetical protein